MSIWPLEVAVGHGRDPRLLRRFEFLDVFLAEADQHLMLLLGVVDRLQGDPQPLGRIVGFPARQVHQCFKLRFGSHDDSL
jgi:hypothetical protein